MRTIPKTWTKAMPKKVILTNNFSPEAYWDSKGRFRYMTRDPIIGYFEEGFYNSGQKEEIMQNYLPQPNDSKD